jgi:hypothetical protein
MAVRLSDPNAWYLTTLNLQTLHIYSYTDRWTTLADKTETTQRNVENKQRVHSDANAISDHT